MPWLHWTLPLLTLHSVVIWLLWRGLHVRPELWLVHGHQGLWWPLEMMMVLLLLYRSNAAKTKLYEVTDMRQIYNIVLCLKK